MRQCGGASRPRDKSPRGKRSAAGDEAAGGGSGQAVADGEGKAITAGDVQSQDAIDAGAIEIAQHGVETRRGNLEAIAL